jgi:hypothetical protein
MAIVVNKVEILQPILDKIEPGWHIEKPSSADPCDFAPTCVFQHNIGPRRVTVTIDNDLFQHGKLEEIEKTVRAALDSASPPAGKILIELSSKDYESLLGRTTEESPVYFRLKNAVKNQSGLIDILCFPDEAEMLLRVANQINPDAALKIEKAITDNRRA